MKRTSANRAKRVPETNQRIKLFDAEEGFIGEFEINPSARILPHVVLVGRPGFRASNRSRAGQLL